MISNIVRNYKRKKDKVKPYLEFKSSTPMTITPNYTNTGVTLQYSLNAKTWNNITAKGVTPSSEVIYFRGRATGTKTLFTSGSPSNAWIFTSATNLEVHGDITMLLQSTLGGMVSDIALAANAFSYMFMNCTSLIKAPSLPSTTLADFCYAGIFYGCTSLTTASALPATTLFNRCYASMFSSCTSLTTAPALPATTLAESCYLQMFRGCTSLTTTPSLPATTLADGCYYSMFRDCTSLTTIPSLPATTLANSCYFNMLASCTKIKLSTTKTGSYQTAYRVPFVGTGKVADNSLSYMFTYTGGTFASTPTINTTYYTVNQVI